MPAARADNVDIVPVCFICDLRSIRKVFFFEISFVGGLMKQRDGFVQRLATTSKWSRWVCVTSRFWTAAWRN